MKPAACLEKAAFSTVWTGDRLWDRAIDPEMEEWGDFPGVKIGALYTAVLLVKNEMFSQEK